VDFETLKELPARLLHWVESFAATPYGDWALFLLAFAESSFFPIPPDVLLIALCLGSPESSLWFALLCTLGSVTGGMAGYAIGFYGGRPLLKRLFDPRKIRAVESLYDRFNAWATGIAGLTPLPYKIFTVSGGVFAINFKIFVVASIAARGLRFFAVAGLMYVYGEPVKAFIERYLNVLSVLFVVILVGGYWLVTHVLGRAGGETLPADASLRTADESEGKG
jgi:membrane protein YqaA with SNARE-associated domain